MDEYYTYNPSSQDEDIFIEIFTTNAVFEIHPMKHQISEQIQEKLSMNLELLMKEELLLSYYQTLLKHTLQSKENKKTLLQLPKPFSLFPIKILTKIDMLLPSTKNNIKR